MPNPLSGPGIGLPFPQNLYPSQLQNAPQDPSSNKQALAPGDSFVLPAGDWYVTLGLYNVIQYLDPVTGTWTTGAGAAFTRGQVFVKSDGFNCRVANLTGCVYSASIAAGGTNYVQSSTTINAIGSFSNGLAPTLVPIVGGALGSPSLTAFGAGYGVAPIVMIPPPPPAAVNSNGVGGIPAEAVALLGAGGSVTSVSLINPGAGYPTIPTAVIVPSPFDPNMIAGNSITQAAVSFSLASAGAITGVLCTNNGAPLPNGSLTSVTLSVGGAGTAASLTANVMQTVVTASVSGAGVGANGKVTTTGGVPAAGAITNAPEAEFLSWEPRPADIGMTSATAGAPGSIYDGGLFAGAPTAIMLPGAGVPTIATIALTMGSRADRVIIQQAP